MLKEAEQLADDMRVNSGVPMGDVRVGLLPSVVSLLAGPLFAQVQAKWPGIRLHFTEGSSAQLEEWLGLGRLDMSLLLRDEDTATSDEAVLAHLRLHLIVPSRHELAARKAITFDEVARLPLVLPSPPHPLRARLAKLAKQKGVSIMKAVEADSIDLQHEIVAYEGGFAITVATLAPRHAPRLTAIPITEPELVRSVVLGVTRHRAHTHATKEVARLLESTGSTMLKPPPLF